MYNLELKTSRQPVWSSHWDKEFEKIFDVFTGPKSEFFAPQCEILDSEKSYGVSLDVPGLKKEDIEIEVKDNHLYVTGERKLETRTEKNNVLRNERRYGKFSRVFTLPPNVNADHIEARFEHGVLDIHIPKEEKAQAKKISILN